MARICIYGAASDRILQEYKDGIYALGKTLAEDGHSLVFGAGSTGLMGAAARGFTDGGGYTLGVAPSWMSQFEPLFDCSQTIIVDTMSQRKDIMEENAEAFCIVPGGIGTMDEFFQILTNKELGQLDDKPIVVYNFNGFYDKLKEMLQSMHEHKFLREATLTLVKEASTPEEAKAVLAEELEKARVLREKKSLLNHEFLQDPKEVSERVLPQIVDYIYEQDMRPHDMVIMIRNILDDVADDLFTYKKTLEEFHDIKPDSELNDEFFQYVSLPCLIDWEYDQDLETRRNEEDESLEDPYEYRGVKRQHYSTEDGFAVLSDDDREDI